MSIKTKQKKHGTTQTLLRSAHLIRLSNWIKRTFVRKMTKMPNVYTEFQSCLTKRGKLSRQQQVFEHLTYASLGDQPEESHFWDQRTDSLEFARSHVTKHEIYWKNILWSDETKLELFGLKVKCYVWHTKYSAIPKIPSKDDDNTILCGCFSIGRTENFETTICQI